MNSQQPQTWQDIEAYRKALKDKGLKATPQREAVHEVMMQLGHASVDQVREALKAKVTTASVYNILSQMADAGIYSRRLSAEGKMYFDVNPTCRIHLYDPSTGMYLDIQDEEVVEYVETKYKRRRFKGFKVDGIDIQILCHQSQPKKK